MTKKIKLKGKWEVERESNTGEKFSVKEAKGKLI